MLLTSEQREIFRTWYTSHGEYLLDPANPGTARVLAEAAFERGVRSAEVKEYGMLNGRLVTRYGKR